MEASADFLSREEILAIFESFAKNKKKEEKQDAKGKKKGKGAEEEQVEYYKERSPGEVVWIKNDDFNDNIQDNSQKPFYKVQIIEDNGDKITCKLLAGEECQEPKFQKARFEHSKKHVMDNSAMAEDGIQDMINIDELNHSTVLYNLYKRYIRDEIYTYVGPTLLAVNPFKRVMNK